MLLLSLPPYAKMGDQLAASLAIPICQWSSERFPNQELHASIPVPVKRETCLLLGTIAPPDEHLLSFLLLSHTLKKEGAGTCLALLPYLAYARDEKPKTGQSMATGWVATLLRACGIDTAVTLDVHSTAAQRLFPMPIVSLSPASLFAQEIHRFSLLNATIVAPDEGARERCQAVANAAGMTEAIVVFEKRRTPEGVAHVGISGEVRQQAVIIDDILDTGGTLLSCCEHLQRRGVEDITIMVTHGLFTGERWRHLWSLGVRRLFCTDTIPRPKERGDEHIITVSVLPLLAHALQARTYSRKDE